MSRTGSRSSVVLLHGALMLAARVTWGGFSGCVAMCMVFAMSRRAMLGLRLTCCEVGGTPGSRCWVPPSRGVKPRLERKRNRFLIMHASLCCHVTLSTGQARRALNNEWHLLCSAATHYMPAINEILHDC